MAEETYERARALREELINAEAVFHEAMTAWSTGFVDIRDIRVVWDELVPLMVEALNYTPPSTDDDEKVMVQYLLHSRPDIWVDLNTQMTRVEALGWVAKSPSGRRIKPERL